LEKKEPTVLVKATGHEKNYIYSGAIKHGR
jgi:hypothetical protein